MDFNELLHKLEGVKVINRQLAEKLELAQEQAAAYREKHPVDGEYVVLRKDDYESLLLAAKRLIEKERPEQPVAAVRADGEIRRITAFVDGVPLGKRKPPRFRVIQVSDGEAWQ